MRTPAEPVTERWVWLAILLLGLLVGAWLRLWQIDSQILIDDEWHAMHRLLWADYRDIFLSFGHSDYSIPLTLLFNWMAENIGLSERRMRIIPLVFGLGTMIVLPLALRPWLKCNEMVVLSVLIALSPLLIHFARNVRPYALIVPLGLLAIIALWRWWHEGDRRWLALYWPATVLSAWLHPLTLLFTLGALSWFGVAGFLSGFKTAQWRDFGAALAVGLITVAAAAVLVLPPLLADPDAMASKSGIHQIQLVTFLRAWEFYLGVVNPWLLVGLSALVFVGVLVLWQRDRAFFLFWAYLCALAILAIVILDPAWIFNGLVLARYTAVVIPMALALLAIGLVASVRWLTERVAPQTSGATIVIMTLVLAVVLYLAGPLPTMYQGVNQFTVSQRYHFDYAFDAERNPYRALMDQVPVDPFYREIKAAPGRWEVIEAPWYYESFSNPLMVYQQYHQRLVRIGMISGLCAGWAHGELRPQMRNRIFLRHFVFLDELLDEKPPVNRFVVLRRHSPFEHARELPDIEPCIEAFRERFGAPWQENEDAVVFQLRSETSVAGD